MSLFDSINKATGVIKNKGEKSRIVELMKQPPKERTVPKVINFKPNARHQADLLTLPKDPHTGARWALVVVDAATRYADAEPLTSKTAAATLKALKKIYARGPLRKPSVAIESDDGSEFKGKFKQWCESEGINKKTAMVARHRQVALAEYLNNVLGKHIMAKQHAEERRTNEVNREWVDILPKIVKAYNAWVKKKPQNTEPKIDRMEDLPTLRCKGMSCLLLDKNTRVRVKADRAVNPLSGKREATEKIRAGDFKWDPTIRKVTKIVLKAGQPPMYAVSGLEGKALFTREQLQVVGKETDEKFDPNATWNVDKIIKRVKKSGKVYYEVLWENKEKTQEPRSELIKDIPDMVKAFEKKSKKSLGKSVNKLVKKRV